MIVRPETPRDFAAIRQIHVVAFRDNPYSQQTEHLIVEALRAANALEVSLVAELDGEVAGHVAFSRATIGETPGAWFILGPVGVLPERQRQGIGSAIIERGLEILRSRGAEGCVLVGNPAYYRRFGFRQLPGVTCKGVPDENVLCLPFTDAVPVGEITHHPAFFAGLEDQ
ncbi:MAG: GNAT family N-acetyltransferase [Coriobacteriia bacterium]